MSISIAIKKKVSSCFTLDVQLETDGEACLGILGASGCGKSMTLKCLAGIEKPDSGAIIIDGQTVFDSGKNINLKPQKRRTGYLFQQYALFPGMTILENLLLPLAGRREGTRAGKRLDALRLLERLGLEGLERRLPHELSGGQQQRAALARMLITRPCAVLFDEPFSALDPHLRETMQFEFEGWLSGGIQTEGGGAAAFRNAVLVTHSREEAFRLCPRLALMEDGRVIRQGAARDVFDDPQTLAAARITGCKNITRIERCAGHIFKALDWGIELEARAPAGDTITHAGIRAHHLRPLFEDTRPLRRNEMAVSIERHAHALFEEHIFFTNARAEAAEKAAVLWWKFPCGETRELPPRLFFPPEHLLLLRS